jgi:hypothetical protein
MSGWQTGWVLAVIVVSGVIGGLVLLARTNWLQSDTLKKCVVLSVGVHLLLALIAAAIGGLRPASWGTEDDGRMTMMVVLVEDAVADPLVNPGEEIPPGADAPESAATVGELPTRDSAEIEREPKLAADPAQEASDMVPLLDAEPEAREEQRVDPAAHASTEELLSEAESDSQTLAEESDISRPPAPYADRFGERLQAAAARGGSEATERAVSEGLSWLAKAQSSDGRWDADRHGAGIERSIDGRDRRGAGSRSDHGVTGLALLAFLGAGNTHQSGVHADTVSRGITFLVERQSSNGSLAGEAEFFAALYCHGMATIALAETVAMTGDETLREPLRRAIGYTLSMQNRSTGGWRYAAGDTGDTSQLGWQVMALRSSRLAGVGGGEQAEGRAWRFLDRVSSGQFGGIAAYRPGERPSYAMTAEACLCRMLLGMDPKDPAAGEAMEFLAHSPPDASQPDAYSWYYATLASFHVGGLQWERWNSRMQAAVLSLQRQDAGPHRGSWDPDPVWGGHGGRVYSTSLSVMMLEVYYRYLPMHIQAGRRLAAHSVGEPSEAMIR